MSEASFSEESASEASSPATAFARPVLGSLQAGAALAAVLFLLVGVRIEAAEPPPLVREIYVPFGDLHVLLENDPKRVLLSRTQYEELLAKAAARGPKPRAPQGALLAAAQYTVEAEPQRAVIRGALAVDVLEDGWQSLPLDFSGVALRKASLDDRPASIARLENGSLVLLVEGKGRHALALEIVAPIEAAAARQTLGFRLPQPAASRFQLSVPGDVELSRGASVVSRTYDAATDRTRFELLPGKGDTSLVMTLNSRLKAQDRAVLARSVILDELTQTYERIHATVSLAILHQPVDQFRFRVPEGFEVTEVESPLISRWAIQGAARERTLEIRLREPTTEPVVLHISALRTAAPPANWSLPQLEPLEVVGQMAVVGLALEDRLDAESVTPEGLIPIDVSVLQSAIPASVLRPEPGAASLRPVVAYYAPQGGYRLQGRFAHRVDEISVRTNLLLQIHEQGLEARCGVLLRPAVEKLFSIELAVPQGWEVTEVTGPDRKPLAVERYTATGQASRVLVRLGRAIIPGEEHTVYLHARSIPAGWLAGWQSTKLSLPVFALPRAARDSGAVAVAVDDDFDVRPETLEGLTPLDEPEKEAYGLGGVRSQLAYRYEKPPYQAQFTVERRRADRRRGPSPSSASNPMCS